MRCTNGTLDRVYDQPRPSRALTQARGVTGRGAPGRNHEDGAQPPHQPADQSWDIFFEGPRPDGEFMFERRQPPAEEREPF